MSEQLHPGLHPDPDSLNAFIEGVLPDHERLQCLAHLAECPRCREIAFLAQEPRPAAAVRSPAWKRWFTPVPVLAAAAALCMAVLAVWWFVQRTAGVPPRDTVAVVSQTPAPAPPPAPIVTPEPQIPKPVQPKPEPHKSAAVPARKTVAPVSAPTDDTSPPSLPAPPSISAPTTVTVIAQAPVLTTLPPTIPPPAKPTSGISGTVTDPTGAVITGATIKVRQLDGTVTADARTDVTGQFHVAELPAGRYEVEIGSPGFRQASREVDLQPREMASVKSQLELGSVSEAVEVTAAASTIQTATASVSVRSSRKEALPSHLATVTTGKILLAVDSGGALFVSRNSGKIWKAVKRVWPGKVRSIAPANPSQTAIANFQLTTDSESIWLSRDGAHWYPAPLQH